jgi:hypothetical protein
MLGPKTGGVVGIFCGIGLIAIPWISANRTGAFSVSASIIGPLVLFLSLVMLILPVRYIFVPVGEDDDGKPIYDYHSKAYTPLAYVFAAIGGLLGIGYFLFLKYGF